MTCPSLRTSSLAALGGVPAQSGTLNPPGFAGCCTTLRIHPVLAGITHFLQDPDTDADALDDLALLENSESRCAASLYNLTL